MLTIFACPKSFADSHISRIQRNAITSWTYLIPRPEVLLLGDDIGVGEMAAECGATHIPQVACNEYGTPLLDDMFSRARQAASNPLLAYVNADMILMADFINAVKAVARRADPFLLAGGRWDVTVKESLKFADSEWSEDIKRLVAHQGMFSFWGVDYFVFPQDLFTDIPSFALGRGAFDGWLLWYARSVGADLIDASKSVFAVHQQHDYGHMVAGIKDPWRSTEGRTNVQLNGGHRHWFLLDATHRFTKGRVRRVVGRRLRWRLGRATGMLRRALTKLLRLIQRAVSW